jgi:hypothetical protein
MPTTAGGLRLCGLCGQLRRLSKTHVPPQVAGNTGAVTRARTKIEGGVRSHGRFERGGMWLRGLCADCNSLAGGRYDKAYADFHFQVERFLRAGDQRLLRDPREVPAARFAPGLVFRSVMFGFFAMTPVLRTVHPELAEDLLDGRDDVRWPDKLRLALAFTSSGTARLAGPIGAYRILTRSEAFQTHGEIWFRPLVWVLAPPALDEEEFGTSILDSQGWADASDWHRYRSDRTQVDLRNIVRRVPLLPQHPLNGRSHNEWMQMYSDEITPILEGQIP